jgi:subtilisin family serine protease
MARRKDTQRASRTFGRIEHLEDRRVMSSDPAVDLLPGVDHFSADDGLPAVDQHVLTEPDFWIDQSLQTDLDTAFDGVEQMLTQAHNLTGWFNVKNNYGFTGLGQTVAVIDSGIAWNHFALGGGMGQGYRVVGGWDFSEENDSNPYDDGTAGGHGTHVSGIIGSSNGTNTGVAPGVDLVGLRVFNDSGQGFFSWIENALRWVHTNRNSFANPITAVNLSLGVSSWNSATIPAWANLEDELAQLKADGIFIAVSAGNSYSTYNTTGLSYPAASPFVVPVMSTNDAGQMSAYSQRMTRGIAAPGQSIVSTVPDYKGNNNGVADDYMSMSGTSMAAPYVAGASVLIRQAMQFVGMTNINQDTIYNHMMATADSFYDAATSLNYKRLNLARAIDALMPADDYGSIAAAAHNLGTINGATSTNGRIGQLTDVDFFQFTAAANTQITFTANGSTGFNPSWQLVGATAISQSGGSISFNVLAGQTYTVGLSSPTAMATYTLTTSVGASIPISITDWGSVAFNQFLGTAADSDQWYRVQASQAGYLTALGVFNQAGGSATVQIYNASMQLLSGGATGASWTAASILASANATYYLKVTGANADVDLSLCNLVSQSGSTVTVTGTSGNDYFHFDAGARALWINGIYYAFGTPITVNVNLGAGADTAVLYGTSGADTATLRFGSAALAGAGYTATVLGAEAVTAYGNGGADQAHLYDSAGNDLYRTYANHVDMTGQGQTLAAWNFALTTGYASTGYDQVQNYDSTGNDEYRTYFDRTIMSGAGYANEARGFDTTFGYASQGVDRVYSHDSANNDWYDAYANCVVMYGGTHADIAYNFDFAVGYSSGGYDFARFYDTPGNDTYRAWSNRAVMAGTGFENSAEGFDQTIAFAGGGLDTAYLYDSSGNDQYHAWGNRAILQGSNFYNVVYNFESTIAAAASGVDLAFFYDSAGDDSYSAWSNRALMTGAGYSNDASGFDSTSATFTTGYDQVQLYDSTGNDRLTLRAALALFEGTGFRHQITGLDRLIATTASGWDTKDVQAVDYLFDLVGNWK